MLFYVCFIFSWNTENGFAKAALFVSKVFVANSYTHLENLVDWMADIFFVATRGKLEPFDSDVAKQHESRNSIYHFFLLLLSSHSIPGVWKKMRPSPVWLNCSRKKNIHSAVRLNCLKKICVRSAVWPCRSKIIYIRSAVQLNCSKKICIRSTDPFLTAYLAVSYPFACRAFSRSDVRHVFAWEVTFLLTRLWRSGLKSLTICLSIRHSSVPTCKRGEARLVISFRVNHSEEK